MGFGKKLFREARRVVHQASSIPIVGPMVVPVLIATVPLAAPILTVAAVVEDPKQILPTIVGSVAPQLAPAIAIVEDPKRILPAIVGSVAPEVAPLLDVVQDPTRALPAIVGSIAPDVASLPIVRMHVTETSKVDDFRPFWIENPNVLQQDFVWPQPNNLPVPTPGIVDDSKPFWLDDEKGYPKRLGRDFNFQLIPTPNQWPKKVEVSETKACEAALLRADTVCQAAGSSDLGKFAGGDMIVQGLICKAAIDEAARACE